MPMSSAAEAPLLLDTHYWIWLQAGSREAGAASAWKAIHHAIASGSWLLSVISVWELGLLESKGRIQLDRPCEEWVRNALATPGLSVAPLTPEIALASTRLPEPFHADPADRIIVATARSLGARLATADSKIREYARKRHLTIL
jgi:PIN domain nuclease of toxin-antitoxin system